MAPRVLVSDKLSPTAVQIFKDRGVEVDYLPDLGKDKEKLLEVIGQYDGLAIRSATKVTEKLIAAATNLKVVGRAGIGVDNVDIPAASRRGIIVMNTPFGNSITTAEHAIACLREHAEKFRDRPFFHFLVFTAPHFPLHAPAADIARVGSRYQVGWDVIRRERHSRQKALGLAGFPLAEMERELGPPYAFPDAMAKLGPGEVNRPLPWMRQVSVTGASDARNSTNSEMPPSYR